MGSRELTSPREQASSQCQWAGGHSCVCLGGGCTGMALTPSSKVCPWETHDTNGIVKVYNPCFLFFLFSPKMVLPRKLS